MQHPKNIRIQDFTYTLPDERIARYPLEQRDESKLLIYEKGNIGESRYRDLAEHIPSGSMMLFNETKVVPARLLFRKPTGGSIEIFCLEPHQRYGDVQTAMTQKGAVLWQCMIGGASKWKNGVVLTERFESVGLSLSASLTGQESGMYTVEFSWSDKDKSFAEVLEIAGKIPLPPYLKRDVEASDKDRYQTVYAAREGSVAAPTAGLHFTEAVFNALQQKGIKKDFVTLHVGAGTFKPVKAEKMEEHDMHAEWIDVNASLLDTLLEHEGKIIVTGTTTLRTLESLYWLGAQLLSGKDLDLAGIAVAQWIPYETEANWHWKEALTALKQHLAAKGMNKLVTRTQIIIAPGYRFRIADALVTNFHQPQSTLLLLVSALIGENWRKVYDYALGNNYRFLSYGDGSLLWRNNA